MIVAEYHSAGLDAQRAFHDQPRRRARFQRRAAGEQTRLEQAGLSVTPILEGLGESPIFRQIYIEKARKALGES